MASPKVNIGLFLFLVFAIQPTFATTRYVTPTGAGSLSGTSWADAASGFDLQFMIDESGSGDSVWVACGVYTPTLTNDRLISFSLKSGVFVYGSFQGNETTLAQRSLTCGPCSILSGEIGAPGIADNSYKVVYNAALTNSAVLDGFVVRDGNDNRSPSTFGNGLGGGIYNHGYLGGGYCSPTIRNCVITNNRASFGGGIFNNGYNGGFSQPVISHCIITQNTATDAGGGIDNYGVGGDASPTLTNCIVYNNTAANRAGGMYCWGGNANGNSNPVIINCAFVSNVVTNGFAGGLIADNLDENGATVSGTSDVVVTNSIFWANIVTAGGPQFYTQGSGTFAATYTAIDTAGQLANIISGPGTGNLFTDPQFVDINNAIGPDNCWMTADDGLRLLNTSLCIDAGDSTGLDSTDLAGDPRVSGLTVDIGPYEYDAPVGFEFPFFDFSASPKGISVYPNPATDFVIVVGENTHIGELQIFNSLGQQMTEWLQINNRTGLCVTVDVSALPPGIYLIGTAGKYSRFTKL